jgi:hypothetical protein
MMKKRIASFKRVSLVIVLILSILSTSSCSVSKPQRRNDTGQINTGQSERGWYDSELNNRAQGERTTQNGGVNMVTYKIQDNPKQNYNKHEVPKAQKDHENGLGAAIGGVFTWIWNGLFGSH